MVGTSSSPRELARDWLAKLARAIQDGDVAAFGDLLTGDVWLRDIFVFGDRYTSCHGWDHVKEYLDKGLLRAQLSNFALNDGQWTAPAPSKLDPSLDGRRIKLVSGTEIAQLGAKVELANGDSLEVDSIIMVTGYSPMIHALRRYFGDDVDQIGPIWGVDEHGELRAGFQPSGVEGLYLAIGDFAQVRSRRKWLALYLRGKELGYLS